MHETPAKAKRDRQMDRQTTDKVVPMWRFALLAPKKSNFELISMKNVRLKLTVMISVLVWCRILDIKY